MAEQIISKRCPRCKQTKPISEFYKDKVKKSGFQCHCKICCNLKSEKYRQTKQWKQSQKKYWQSEQGKNAHKKYRKNNVLKCQARHTITYVVKTGKLPHSNSLKCYYCSVQAKQYHHHLGYDFKHWFDVIPVCIPCHRKLHQSRIIA